METNAPNYDKDEPPAQGSEEDIFPPKTFPIPKTPDGDVDWDTYIEDAPCSD